MIDRSIVLEALGVLCTGNVTSVQQQASAAGLSGANLDVGPRQNLTIKLLIAAVLAGDENCQVSRSSFYRIRFVLDGSDAAGSPTMDEIDSHIKSMLDGSGGAASPALDELDQQLKSMLKSSGGAASPALDQKVVDTKKNFILDEDEFFAPQFDYDFTKQTDKKTFWRGGEKYERPCGWSRFGLKVLDKYSGNTWLGTRSRGTKSSRGEWPVSYHGTSKKGAGAIIGDHYEAGPRQVYGRGIYSTPDISEAKSYARRFTSSIDGKKYKVVLQNRINPEYRKKYKNGLYWLVPIPQGTSDAEEQEMVERAIRPYGLLLKEVK